MKKTMIILGAFTLLIAAPTFAQQKSQKVTKEAKVEPVQKERVMLRKAQKPNEKLEMKPQAKPQEVLKTKPVSKIEKVKHVEPVKSRQLKTAQPIKKEESN